VHMKMIFGRVKGVWVRCQKTLVHLKMILVEIKDFGAHENDFWKSKRSVGEVSKDFGTS